MNLEREQIETLNRRLNDVYDGYRAIVDFSNKTAKTGSFNLNPYTLELSAKQRQETSDLMLNELSKIERAVQEMRNLLEDLATQKNEG